MYRNVFVIASGLTLVLASTPAFSETPWYMSIGGGAYFRPNVFEPKLISQGPVTVIGTDNDTFDPGPYFNLSAGYKLPMGFRAEVEFGFATYNIKSIAPNAPGLLGINGATLTGPSGGDRKRYFEMGALYYDFPVVARFTPYAGAGFGAAEDTGSVSAFRLPDGALFHANGIATGTHPVVFGEAGVALKLTDRFDLLPSYRYQYIFQGGNAHYENASIAKVALRYGF